MSNWVIDVYFSHVILRVLERYGIALTVEERESLDDFLVRRLAELLQPAGAVHSNEFCRDLERLVDAYPYRERLEKLMEGWIEEYIRERLIRSVKRLTEAGIVV